MKLGSRKQALSGGAVPGASPAPAAPGEVVAILAVGISCFPSCAKDALAEVITGRAITGPANMEKIEAAPTSLNRAVSTRGAFRAWLRPKLFHVALINCDNQSAKDRGKVSLRCPPHPTARSWAPPPPPGPHSGGVAF